MHVLVIPSWYATKRNKIHGSFFTEQAVALQEMGIKITIAFNEIWPITLLGKIKDKSGITFEEEMKLKTYRYKGYNFLPKNPLMFKIFNKRMDKMFRLIEEKEGKIDIIHAHSSLWGGIAAAYISKKYNIPLIITEHSSLKKSRYLKKSYMKEVINSYKSANALIAVSNHLKSELKQATGREDIKVINNLVDLDKFTLGKKLSKEDKPFKFFSCGFLDRDKGMDSLINAFHRAFKNDDVLLSIGGEGEERERLMNLIEDKKLSSRVKLLGALSREEVAEEMKNCHGFILASRHETFGVVYIEALASGKPIIATKNGGAEEIVEEYNGLLAEIDDIDSIALAMETLKKNYDQYDKEQIREKCLDKYSREKICSEIIKCYEEILNESAK